MSTIRVKGNDGIMYDVRPEDIEIKGTTLDAVLEDVDKLKYQMEMYAASLAVLNENIERDKRAVEIRFSNLEKFDLD